MGGKEFGVRAPKNFPDLGERPDIELALLAFRIGIERSAERSLPGRHLAREPSHRLARAGSKQLTARALMRERDELEQKRIVVEHLLEMRDEPVLIDRIAREAAAEMIIDAALANALER